MESEEEDEAKVPKQLKDPRTPSRREVEEHNLTHLPFRDWCPYCIQGGAPNKSHYKQEGIMHDVPHLACDYGFLGDI